MNPAEPQHENNSSQIEPSAPAPLSDIPGAIPGYNPAEPAGSRKMPRKKLLLLAAVTVLLGIGTGIYYFTIAKNESASNTNNADSAKSSKSDIQPLYNYASIRDAVDFDGYRWVALGSGAAKYKDQTVTFYDQIDGLDGPNGIKFVVFNNSLWMSTLHGVSRYDGAKDTFVPYFSDVTDDGFSTGISNVNLFVNPLNNELSVSSFQHFYTYDQAADRFIPAVTGPINSQHVFFNNTTGLARKYGTTDLAAYTVQTGWVTVPQTSEIFAEQSASVIEVDGRFVVFGRSKNYYNCDSQGTAAATVFYEYLENGTLTPIDSLNAEFANQNVMPAYAGDLTEVSVDSCGSSGSMTYAFRITDGEFTLTKIKDSMPTLIDPTQPQPYIEDIEALRKIIKRDPIIKVIAIEKDGSVLAETFSGIVTASTYSYNSLNTATNSYGESQITDSIVRSKDGTFTDAQLIKKFSESTPFTHTRIVLCDGTLAYVLRYEMYESDFSTSAITLSKVAEDGTLGDPVVVSEDTAVNNGSINHVACTESSLFWVQNNVLVTFDRLSDAATVSKIFDGAMQQGGMMESTALYGSRLYTQNTMTNQSPYGYVSLPDGTYHAIDYEGITFDSERPASSNRIVAVNDTYIWLAHAAAPNRTSLSAFTYDGALVHSELLAGSTYLMKGSVIDAETVAVFDNYDTFSISSLYTVNVAEKSKTPTDKKLPIRGDAQSIIYDTTRSKLWFAAGDTSFALSY